MEPPPAAKPAAQSTKLCLFAGSSSYSDPDVMEMSVSSSSSAWGSSNPKRKRSQVVPHEIIDLDKDDDMEVVFIAGNSSDYKNKKPVTFVEDFKNQVKDDLSKKYVGSSTNHVSDNVSSLDILKSSIPGSLDFHFPDGYDYDDCDYDYDDDTYEGFEFDTDLADSDYNFSLAAKFDDLDLPTGVEANVPWLHKPASGKSNRIQPKVAVEDAVDLKFKAFKQFDTVQGDYDHYFARPEHVRGYKAGKKPSKDWAKRIQHEWKVLEKDLPETIYVRVYEDRMDILRAVIIGPAGTPYHDGLFFFDAYFPSGYPSSPPLVHYHSGGLRLNPNLYACGKVCLSLLGTWSGSGCETWNPSNSTMLQVLVSIQALVLNAKPYFNEPGFAPTVNTPHGEQSSLLYNEQTYLLSCRTMLYSLRRPPKHFEDFVTGHFRKRGHAILVACRAYLEGAQVGCLAGGGVQDVDEGDKSCTTQFRSSLKTLFDELLMEFTVKGADCDEFLAQKVKNGVSGAAADTTLKL